MCGLLGQLRFSGGRDPGAEPETLRRLSGLAARRGPDGEGLWSDGTHCTLAFRRLSILDLSSAADQPMRTRDGRYALVYNGELYNFRELRRELEANGLRFRSSGDSEVVLEALAAWGAEAALRRFNGMFALGFYDTHQRRLLLARDHAGMKPLYVLTTANGVVFASQYDQIVAHPWAREAGWSADGLALYLRLGHVPAPYGLLRGSHELEAGSWLEVDGEAQERRGRFFELDWHRQPDLSGAAADEAVEAAVAAAVKRHLVADVEVGAFLSGGIDSPLVAAMMSAAGHRPLRTFTLGTGGDEYDESADALAYAAEIGAEPTVAQLSDREVLEGLDDVVAACAEPSGDYSIFPTLAVARTARRRTKVVLSGDGGDELFWGYAGRFGAMLQAVAGLRAPSGAGGARPHLAKLLDTGRGPADSRWPQSIGDLYRTSHTHGTEGWLRRIFPGLPAWPDGCRLFVYEGREVDETARWLRWNEYVGHLAMVLRKVDRASMFHSLEVRAPLLDREVVEVAARIDWRTCLDSERRIGKLPLRRALAKRVRHQTWAKRGFTVPIGAWLRGPLRPVAEDVLLSRDEIAGLAVDRGELRAVFDRHCAAQADYGWLLWVLLSLVLWEDRHHAPHRPPA
jgi:asparagine synthase (glutamine-hydrolysing)